MLKINFHSICHIITMVEMSIRKSYHNIKSTRKDEHIMSDKELFIQCARQAGISIEDHSMVRVTDFRKVANFLTFLKRARIKFGMDMSSLISSGDVEIVVDRYELCHILLKENDINRVDCFKFRSLLLLLTDLEDPQSSPEMFLESDIDIEWLQKVPEEMRYLDPVTKDNGRYVGLKVPSLSEQVIYDKDSIDHYLQSVPKYCEEQNMEVPVMTRFIRNTEREMIAYINIQSYKRTVPGNQIIRKYRQCLSEDFVHFFQKDYKLIQD